MGWCYEFGTVIADGCHHAMAAGPDSCQCTECGVVCRGRYGACPDVWASRQSNLLSPSDLAPADPDPPDGARLAARLEGNPVARSRTASPIGVDEPVVLRANRPVARSGERRWESDPQPEPVRAHQGAHQHTPREERDDPHHDPRHDPGGVWDDGVRRPVPRFRPAAPWEEEPPPPPAPAPVVAPLRALAPPHEVTPDPARGRAVEWLQDAISTLQDDLRHLGGEVAAQQGVIAALARDIRAQQSLINDLVSGLSDNLAYQEVLITGVREVARTIERRAVPAPSDGTASSDDGLQRTVKGAVLAALRTERELVVNPLRGDIEDLRVVIDRESSRHTEVADLLRKVLAEVGALAAGARDSTAEPEAGSQEGQPVEASPTYRPGPWRPVATKPS